MSHPSTFSETETIATCVTLCVIAIIVAATITLTFMTSRGVFACS